ncbi:MAG TPA: helix-turn-helix transcriptional regulator [Candidatus Saccharimonadales bacterium]|nr:helix-turn-helix transcriptional regulator [Candidatus Saccharimonadales bacterium]
MTTNTLQDIGRRILERFPEAKLSFDMAENEEGSSFLDVKMDDYSLVVEWSPKRGIGITANSEIGYGEGPHEVFKEASVALQRVLELLLSRTKTVTTTASLGQLRRERSLTQAQIAGLLKIQQASVAKIEKRSDILVSTLQAIVSAMGGQVRIRAVFPDGLERELHFGP